LERKKLINIAKLLLKIGFTVLGLWIVYNKVDLKALGVFWRNANHWLLIPALLVFILSQFISSFRLLNFFKNIGLSLPIIYNLRLYLLGMFYSLFLPGGIGGDGYKVLALKQKTGKSAKELVSAVFFDRLSGLWALSFLLVLLAAFVPLFGEYTYWIQAGFVVGTVLYYFVIARFFKAHITRFFPAHGLAILVQGLQLVCVAFIMKALGYEGAYFPYFLIFLLSSLATLFPFSIGGLGAREIGIVWGATTLSLDKNLSVSISLCFYFISALLSLSAVFLLFRKDREALANDPQEKK